MKNLDEEINSGICNNGAVVYDYGTKQGRAQDFEY
jgi:hypothetical protein